jgi:hypothetical protein
VSRSGGPREARSFDKDTLRGILEAWLPPVLVQADREEAMSVLSRRERLGLIYAVLSTAPPCSSEEDVHELLETAFDAVEDAHGGVPKNVDPNAEQRGRMYPRTPISESSAPSHRPTAIVAGTGPSSARMGPSGLSVSRQT